MQSRITSLAAWVGACLGIISLATAQTVPFNLVVSNNTKTVSWPLVPALESYQLTTGSTLEQNIPSPPSGIWKTVAGYSFTVSNALQQQFFKLKLTNMSSDALLTANLLNRIAYGPTPDD